MKVCISFNCLLFLLLSGDSLLSQSLDIELSNQGIVFPSMFTDERDTLNAKMGQCIFNAQTNTLECFDGRDWVAMVSDKELQLEQSPKAQSVIRPSDFTNELDYGSSTDIDGAYLIVGDPFDDDKGAAYIYNFNGIEWVEQAKLAEDNGDDDYQFGHSVALEGDFAFVGAPLSRKDDDETGAVYCFKREGQSWLPYDTLYAVDREDADRFGESISLFEDYLIIGASNAKNDDNNATGKAYIYELINGAWSLDTILIPTSDDADAFGIQVANSRFYAAISTEDYSNTQSDSVYVYRRTGDVWELMKSIRPEGNLSSFGPNIALQGSELYVIGRQISKGAIDYVYVFRESFYGDWEEVQSIQFEESVSSYVDIRFSAMDNLLAVSHRTYQNETVVTRYHRIGSDWRLKNSFSPLGIGNRQITSLSLSKDCMVLGIRDFTTDDIHYGGVFIF